MRPCFRRRAKGSPYCWQHTEMLREAAKSLNTSGDLLNAALLIHLTSPLKPTGHRKTPIIHTLEGLEVSEGSPSLGALEQPVEIFQNIISELSLRDLQNFKAVNSRARSMVVSSHKYRNVITYAPEVITALYKTDLDSAFTLIHIHDVLTQARCASCNRFGGYVFLPGLQRCCERCARYHPEFIPIRLSTVEKDDRNSIRRFRGHVPMMLWAVGNELINLPRSRFNIFSTNPETPTENVYLVSSADAARIGKVPNSSSGRVHMPCDAIHKYSWRHTAVPMPHLELRTQIVTLGYRCKGCTRVRHSGGAPWTFYGYGGRPSCRGCQRSLPNGLDIDQENRNHYRWGRIYCHKEDEWDASQGAISCRLHTASGRLYTADEMLVHLAECGEAQSLLADLALLEQLVSETDKLPKHKRKTKPRRHVKYKKY